MNRIFFIITLILTSGCVFAQTEADFLLLQKDYVLHADGSSDLHCRQVIKYNTHVAFNNLYGETFITYNPQQQQLKISESYTIQASGNKVMAPGNAFNEVLPRFAADAPAYNHLREMVVTHTGLELGATAYLDYTLHTNAGYEPELDRCLLLQESSPVKEYKVSVTVPEGKKLAYQLYLAKGNPKVSKKNGATCYEWVFRNVAASSKAYYQPADNSPHLVFSTWAGQDAALQWLAAQMTEGDGSQIKAQMALSGQGSNPYQAAAQAYDFVVNQVADTPVPLEYVGYHMRDASQVMQSAYGTSCEKASLLLAVVKQLGIPAHPVAVYPSFIDGSVASLNAIESFAVSVNAGFDYLLSPASFTSLTLAATKPAYRYVVMSQGARVISSSGNNKASLTSELNVDAVSAVTQSQLRLTGAFNPLLSVWLNESKLKSLLSINTDSFSNMSANESSLSVTLDSKVAVTRNGNLYSVLLPEAKGGANSWNMQYLTSVRDAQLAIPYPVDETYSYTVNIPDGLSPVNIPFMVTKENKTGKLNISVEILPHQLKITRSLQLVANIIQPSDYAGFAELMKLWQDVNYRTVMYKN